MPRKWLRMASCLLSGPFWEPLLGFPNGSRFPVATIRSAQDLGLGSRFKRGVTQALPVLLQTRANVTGRSGTPLRRLGGDDRAARI
jgi:hypothetical protein